MRSHLGASLGCTGRSMAKFLTSMLRSRSWEISIPLARKTLDMQDLYPWMEDIASFFSSNRKMRKSANYWTVALTGLICLTWHHSPNTFHLTSMLRSRSWEISILLARKTLDMQDLYPWMEDIASFFSSNRKMRKSANYWTVALTGLICLTWHHSPNTFHLDS